ncbi:MAG TPA: hypothetical protein VGV93_05980 [Acidimicrobiales bacterium]|nr:hypothetical protein [Acidimicrobiales bacterium]
MGAGVDHPQGVAGLVMALPILVAALDASVAPLKAVKAYAGSES